MISGKEFNEKYKDMRFVKLTNGTNNHNGHQYTEGPNVCPDSFNPNPDCKGHGFYFCKEDDFIKWLYYNKTPMYHIWNVRIINKASVVVMKNKIKCDRFILSECKSIWDNQELCDIIVKEDGLMLGFVIKQSNQQCIDAVTQNPIAIGFVNDQTDEINKIIIEKDKSNVQYVLKKTHELSAIVADDIGLKEETIKELPENTKEIKDAIKELSENTEDLQLKSVKENGLNLKDISNPSQQVCNFAIDQNKDAFQFIPKEKQTFEMCLKMVKLDGFLLQYVHCQTQEICNESIRQNPFCYKHVKIEFRGECKELKNLIMKQNRKQ